MAVAATVQLGDQPGTGRIRQIPLGGNGKTAPISMYEVQVALANDASGDESTITVNRDPRYTSICTLIGGTVTVPAAGIEMLFEMQDTENAGPISRGFANAVPIASVGGTSIAVWNPPPIMTMTTWRMITANVDGDTAAFQAWFYNFDRRILELTPMYQILANLPRSGSMDSFSAA